MSTTRSDPHAALIKRRALPVKIERQQPFDPECFLSHGDGGRTKAKYQKNETIFRQGDSEDAVFYIMDGACKATVVSEKGKGAVVAFHERGEFFGEGCLTGQPRRLGTVTAITMSEIMRFDKAAMVRALHDEPKFSELFISHLLARNVRVLNLRADIYDPKTLAAMDQAFAAVWHMLRADKPFRDYANDTELKIAIGKKLLNLVAEGVTDPLRLRNLTVESLLLLGH